MEAGTGRYLDGTYAAANESWHEDSSPFKAQWIASFVNDHRTTPDSVCDVGCGTGGVLSKLQRAWPDAKMVGYDVSPQAVELATTTHPEVDVRFGDVVDAGEQFDLLLMLDVFEHVEDYLGFVRRVAPLACQMVFHIPLDMNALMVARDRPIAEARQRIGHLHYFSKTTAVATLEDAGYEVLATRYTGGAVELPSQSFKSTLARWPRKVGFRLAPDLTVRMLGGYSMLALAQPRRPAG
jgi:cyclopropane fatty-acyl-phospholipid synthase-like methyltransferase